MFYCSGPILFREFLTSYMFSATTPPDAAQLLGTSIQR